MVPAGSQLSGALRMTVVARNTTVPPSLAMPPAAEAVLRVTRLPLMTRRPWLARPPPVAAEFPDTVPPMTVAVACGALPSPPPNPEAELPDSTLFLMVSTPVPGGLGGSNGADLADHRVLRRGLDAARPVSAPRVTDEQHPAMRHANPSDPLLAKEVAAASGPAATQ